MDKKQMIDDSYNIREIEVDSSWTKDFEEDYFEYRKKWDLASQPPHVLFDFPLFLEVEASYACNYFCPCCPRQALQHTKKKGFLNNELFNKLLLEVRQYKMPAINLSHGGESLIRKDIPELIRRAKEHSMIDIMFHTNGSLLTKELSFELIKSGLTKINISLDAASAEVYRKVRTGGEYNSVVANVYDFLEVKKAISKSYPRVRVSFVVCDENKHEQKAFYELWKDKVNIIAFQQFYDFLKRKESGNPAMNDWVNKPYCCSQLWQLLTISCEGDILPCLHDYEHENILGNLKTHSIYECWNSKRMNEFRELHLKNRWYEIPMCYKCVTSVKRVAEV